MPKSYCIVCGKERNGIAVEDDYVLGSIRWFKERVTKNVKNNRLVVCKECYPKYSASRKKFEFRQKVYVGLGIAFAAVSLIVSPRLPTLLVSIVVFAFLFALSLMSYTPRITIKKQHNQ